MEVSGQLHFKPAERVPGTHWTGDWVDANAGLDTAVAKRNIPFHRREQKPGRSARILVTILTELSRLTHNEAS